MLVLWAGCEQERFKTRMARSVLHFPWKCLLKALICIYQYYCRSIRPEIKLGAIQVSSSAILMEGEIVPGLNWCFWEVRLCESKSQKWAGMISSMCHIITWTSDQRSLPSGHEGNQKFSKKAGLEVMLLSVISICVLDVAASFSCHPLPSQRNTPSTRQPSNSLIPQHRAALLYAQALPFCLWGLDLSSSFLSQPLLHIDHACTLSP